MFKNACYLLTASAKSNTQVDNSKDLDAVMPTQNLIDYSNNYPKTLFQYYKYFPNNNMTGSESFKSKSRLTNNNNNTNMANAEIAAPLHCIKSVRIRVFTDSYSAV